MKQQIVHIHGGEAFSTYEMYLERLRTMEISDPLGLESPRKGWSKSMGEVLGDDFEVYRPSMPSHNNAKYEEWKIWFERYFGFLHDGVILIGHSQGGEFLYRYLSENQLPVAVRGLITVGAPAYKDDFGEEDGGDFHFKPDLVKDISNTIKDIHLFHSKDDDIVPFSHAERLQELLPAAHMHIFEDRGHFLQETFPELLDLLKKMA
ncbi:hypothetical protein GW943_02655 [Candidatus Parcubacteria bacterium]|uniref:Serine hydrolase FSH domain-containing protein n=1 Tax=Candidatus Kaiserbacteria bacterium CG10_big_fil_rev_8_21_14_0_10_47_16 TaxID=1974608 RepID=A0A2H0UDZ9_9BACT|nr:hypothetical protein [Candidatus Parcubacteria bacterium]PIR84580.1 MAG: hypothetical protein COU16_03320 [Candidatus Kaiserbacteria bacterium CG10_big_fil_rev_8_21_14_0_10_47_16]